MSGVRQVGRIPFGDLPSQFQACDVFLLPSLVEGLPQTLLEAMACGLPVVAAEATGATNLVRDGETGTLVDPSDLDGFADALAAYAEDPELRRRHGEGGLAFARTMDWDHINSVALRVYERAIVKRERLSRMTGR